MNGKAHLIVNISASVPLLALGLYVKQEMGLSGEEIIAGCVGYALASTILTPDIDLKRTLAHRIARRLPFGKLIVLWMRSYALAFKHRGVSHWPIIGTLTRYLWFVVPVSVLLTFEVQPMLFVGMVIADLLHVLADWIES